jgi:uncharacterized protein YdeI (YjbR/CyaY-like superfamily)
MGDLAGDRFQEVEVDSLRALHAWLDQHCEQHEGVWLVTCKKAVPSKYIPHGDVLDALVAHGWCDGRALRIDDTRVMQLVSPRRTQPWAKSYKDRADRLAAAGQMCPTGLASVQRAKATGMWDAMNDVDALVVPDDLRDALLAASPADEFFDVFPQSTRRNILRWISSAKTASTREKRIRLTVEEARLNRRVRSNG